LRSPYHDLESISKDRGAFRSLSQLCSSAIPRAPTSSSIPAPSEKQGKQAGHQPTALRGQDCRATVCLGTCSEMTERDSKERKKHRRKQKGMSTAGVQGDYKLGKEQVVWETKQVHDEKRNEDGQTCSPGHPEQRTTESPLQ